MNKTVTVNIGGIVFHIDENAYDTLRNYLESLRRYFTTSEGSDEIIQDIESRIAEMFQAKLNNREVVELNDVNEVIRAMGKPEDFADAASQEIVSDSFDTTPGITLKKRLFRDPDEKVIGGVCAGISHYLAIDPLWLRLILIISFFFFGSGILLYIILWIIMPEAKTTAEKLQMQGEQINIATIEKSVREELGTLKQKGDFIANDIRSSSSGFTSFLRQFFSAIGAIVIFALKFILKLLAFFMIIIGLAVFAAIVMGLLGSLGFAGIALPWVTGNIFTGTGQMVLAFITVFLVIGIPFMLLVYYGIKYLFRIKREDKYIGRTAMALWVSGLITAGILAASVGSNFAETSAVRAEDVIDVTSDTIFLRVDMDEFDERNFRGTIQINGHEDFVQWSRAEVKLDIRKSEDDKVRLVKLNSSRGKTKKEAIDNANQIAYDVQVNDSLILFPRSFYLNENQKFRVQKVQLVLMLPEGKTVHLAGNLDEIIFDIKNVTNTYDGDMINHKWTMTNSGLECIDCEFIEKRKSKSDNDWEGNIHLELEELDEKLKKLEIQINDSLPNRTHIKARISK